MKKSLIKKSLVLVTLLAAVCINGISYAEDTSKTKEKGPALQQLEAAAGKKIEDVKVPAVPDPTPVSSYEVNTSTDNPKGN